MNDWLLVLQIYFGVGLVVCLAVVISHVWMKRRQASSLTDALKSLNPSRQRFWYRVVEDMVVPGLAFILVWLVWPVAIGFKFFEMYQKKEAAANSERLAKAKVFVLKEEALVREMTVAEIEQANMVIDPLGAAPNLPFGHLHAVWVEFRDGLGVGETVYLFESVGPNVFRKQLIWGYAVCKAGRVERFMTAGWRR
jgi:glycerol-3-phosphate acyltransferase PlsY